MYHLEAQKWGVVSSCIFHVLAIRQPLQKTVLPHWLFRGCVKSELYFLTTVTKVQYFSPFLFIQHVLETDTERLIFNSGYIPVKEELVLQQFFSFLSPTHRYIFWCEGRLSTRKSYANNKQGHPLGWRAMSDLMTGKNWSGGPSYCLAPGRISRVSSPHNISYDDTMDHTINTGLRRTRPSSHSPWLSHRLPVLSSPGRRAAHCPSSKLTRLQEEATQSCAMQRKCEHRQAQTDHHTVLKYLVEEQLQTAKLTRWAECSHDPVCFCPNCLESFHQGRGKPQLPSQLSWGLWELKEATHALVHLSTVPLLWTQHPTPVPVWTQPDQPWKFSFPVAESVLSVFLCQFITVCYWVHNALTILLMTKVINLSPYILHSSSL